ncbi:DNA-directed RNA polymerase III subunit RPC7 isoform X2 [Varanus komodoensis]|uniref:DNA-directed RNA polymerase III subunit RPC7 isoform X2 n=1 Tax=Varanus komodoensis TaxID=61221 RepID=UPI001CF7B2A7|nr:DNA-directed RNA polymerase III subunit RPC7 isoform X2 [Varanus komodoensis]
MARSGRGRGRASLTFNIEVIGFGRGEALPEAVFQPPPLYPTTDFKPIPLKTGEGEDYCLALKQELRNAMRKTPYFMSKNEDNQGFVPVERYSKKYLQRNGDKQEWTPGGKPNKAKTATSKTNVDILKKIEELEKKGDGENSDEEEKGKETSKDKEEEEEGDEAEEYNEEEHEEENDYIASYFEDGDDYGADSDDNMDEATY